MGTIKRIKALPVLLMPGDTVGASIKKLNLYNVSKEEMNELLSTFRELNGIQNFKPGTRVMIPILERNHEEVFSKSTKNS